MNRKQKLIISITGITIVMLALLGITYAYYLTRIEGNTNTNSISVTTADLKLQYSDGTNEILIKNNIMPGTNVGTKDFTVTNNGNTKIDGYGVYLEEVINTLISKEDMTLEVTCESSDGNTCSEYTGIYPSNNVLLVENSIAPNTTHSYKINIFYKETNIDQSDDMGAILNGKVQIYAISEVIDIKGTITGSVDGDFVQINSETKKSQIINDEYILTGIKPGVHTLSVRNVDSNGNEIIKFSKEIKVKLGTSSQMEDNIITMNETTIKANANINITNSTLNLTDIFSTKTLKDEILNNATYNKNGTQLVSMPYTKIAEEISSINYEQGKEEYKKLSFANITDILYSEKENADFFSCYWGVDNSYYDETTGEYVERWEYPCDEIESTTSCDDLINKYAFVPNYGIYYVVNCKDTIPLIEEKVKYEKIISTDIDDYGTSYYFRGNIDDNYVNFANMCWRIVRIEGDESIKLILEDQDNVCESSNGNWDIPTSNGTTLSGYSTGNYGYVINSSKYRHSYLEPTGDRAMVNAFKYFQNNNLKSYLSYLKTDEWCLESKAYKGYTLSALNTTPVNQSASTNHYYDSRVRLLGLNNEGYAPTLKCNGEKVKKYSDGTEMKVGTLTANELVYAGGKVYAANYDYYLMNAYQIKNSLKFWSLSLDNYSSYNGTDFAMAVFENGAISDGDSGKKSVYSNYSIRPSVTLNAGIEISKGKGIKENPYIIATS